MKNEKAVAKNIHTSGFFCNGLPYKRSVYGSRSLVVFQGLTFEHKPQAVMLLMYMFLEND